MSGVSLDSVRRSYAHTLESKCSEVYLSMVIEDCVSLSGIGVSPQLEPIVCLADWKSARAVPPDFSALCGGWSMCVNKKARGAIYSPPSVRGVYYFH